MCHSSSRNLGLTRMEPFFLCLERNTDVFALEAGRSLCWPDSYQSFQHGIFVLASPEQRQPGVYPGQGGRRLAVLALQGEVLSFLPSSAADRDNIGSPSGLNHLVVKAQPSLGLWELLQEALQSISCARPGFNTFSVAS